MTGSSGESPSGSAARERFLAADAYRVQREWDRYEGTAQRDLFLALRTRFLDRRSVAGGWALELGCGPGRFLPFLARSGGRAVGMDLSEAMLRFPVPPVATRTSPTDRVRGDALRPPVREGAFSTVAALGNLLGFSGEAWTRLLDTAVGLVAPGGTLLLEIAPGPGERSTYLARLPPGSVARLLRAPVRAVLPRVAREGFRREPRRKSEEGEFARISVPDIVHRLASTGLRTEEIVAVAPTLGADPERLRPVRADPTAWGHLLELEESVGHAEARWRDAAAVLVAATKPLP